MTDGNEMYLIWCQIPEAVHWVGDGNVFCGREEAHRIAKERSAERLHLIFAVSEGTPEDLWDVEMHNPVYFQGEVYKPD